MNTSIKAICIVLLLFIILGVANVCSTNAELDNNFKYFKQIGDEKISAMVEGIIEQEAASSHDGRFSLANNKWPAVITKANPGFVNGSTKGFIYLFYSGAPNHHIIVLKTNAFAFSDTKLNYRKISGNVAEYIGERSP